MGAVAREKVDASERDGGTRENESESVEGGLEERRGWER